MTSSLAPKRAPERLSSRDFDRIRKLAYDYCGLDIEPGKEELVASRVGRIMHGLNITSFSDYFDYVMADRTSQALVLMIDSLTTNHTGFFRERQHFEFLTAKVLPALAQRDQIDIWSAACSSGEEPYSLAFATLDFFGEQAKPVRILATDISTRVLAIGKQATYDAQRFEGVPLSLLQRYLLRGQGASSNLYRVKPAIRALIRFERFNLMSAFTGVKTVFPLILCRNVMIYFNNQTQEALVDRLFHQIEPGGFLFIGHSETLSRISHRFEYVCPAIYRKPGVLKPARSQKVEAA